MRRIKNRVLKQHLAVCEAANFDLDLPISALGSRLNQAHQMIVAAIATADRKLRASLS
jgi:hypothetical protein